MRLSKGVSIRTIDKEGRTNTERNLNTSYSIGKLIDSLIKGVKEVWNFFVTLQDLIINIANRGFDRLYSTSNYSVDYSNS
jgi:hypothetical protein